MEREPRGGRGVASRSTERRCFFNRSCTGLKQKYQAKSYHCLLEPERLEPAASGLTVLPAPVTLGNRKVRGKDTDISHYD